MFLGVSMVILIALAGCNNQLDSGFALSAQEPAAFFGACKTVLQPARQPE
jgi:hypothetical protein